MPIVDRRAALRAGAALPAALLAAPVAGAEPGCPTVQGAGWYGFRFGEARCRIISDGMAALDGAIQSTLAMNATPEAVAAVLSEHFLEQDGATLHFNALFLEIGGRRVLVDTGNGPGRGPSRGRLATHLRAAGTEPASVDTVVLSHGHPDHLGGLLDEAGAPAFPNARVVLSVKEHAFWTGEPDLSRSFLQPPARRPMIEMAKSRLAAVADRIELVEPGQEIVPGLEPLGTPGHTPGHLSLRYKTGAQTLYITSDVVHHHALALAHPEWHVRFDLDPDFASGMRRLMLDQLATDRLAVVAYHFPFPALGHVAPRSSGYAWEPIAWSWDPEATLG